MKNAATTLGLICGGFFFALAVSVFAQQLGEGGDYGLVEGYINGAGTAKGSTYLPYGSTYGFVNSNIGLTASDATQLQIKVDGSTRFNVFTNQIRAVTSSGAAIYNSGAAYSTATLLPSWVDGGGIGYDQTNNHVTVTGPATNPGLAVGFQTAVMGTTVAAPFTCNATTQTPTIVYVDDTDDSSAAEICVCVATGDDGAGTPNAWDWVLLDGSGACTLI